jgi:hypothetical protein
LATLVKVAKNRTALHNKTTKAATMLPENHEPVAIIPNRWYTASLSF